jgi:hypothetical protein
MARIQQTFETSKSIAEMRMLIDTKALNRPEIGLLLNDHRWEGNVLHASGTLGHGTITLTEGHVSVDIELSMFGAAAKGKIEQTLHSTFKQLSD